MGHQLGQSRATVSAHALCVENTFCLEGHKSERAKPIGTTAGLEAMEVAAAGCQRQSAPRLQGSCQSHSEPRCAPHQQPPKHPHGDFATR